MFLPRITSLILCLLVQDPASEPWTVAAGAGEVPDRAVAEVRAEVGSAVRSLQQYFPGQPQRPFKVIVDESAAALARPLQSVHHEGSPGFALLGRSEIHLLLTEIRDTGRGLRPVLVHELTHELLDQWCSPHGDLVPRWFHEGLAQVIAGDTYIGASEEMIVWRAALGRLLPFSELTQGFPSESMLLKVAYAQSYSYVAWLERLIGRPALLAMAGSVDRDMSFDLALVHATDLSTAALQAGWEDHVLHGSGARWRVLLQQFFSISMVLALPLLALALIRRLRVDRRARERMERAEQEAEAAALAAAAGEQGQVGRSDFDADPAARMGPEPDWPPAPPAGPDTPGSPDSSEESDRWGR